MEKHEVKVKVGKATHIVSVKYYLANQDICELVEGEENVEAYSPPEVVDKSSNDTKLADLHTEATKAPAPAPTKK